MNSAPKKNLLIAYTALGAVCVIWGTTYLGLRVGVTQFPPFLFSLLRFTIAGPILVAFMLTVGKASWPDRSTLMHYGLLHNIVAVFYFFSFPLAIFVLAHLNRKNLQYRDWCTHMVSSLTMVACPLLLIKAFHGMAMAEIVHSAIAIAWNIWISRKLTSA
jgi:drug/metabolite transporter (DMT)-like permease